jgi:hypothetical protein
MDKEMLGNYNEWLKRSPGDVLKAVRDIPGGWKTIFSQGLPLWAHRVRNFFNLEPITLTRLSDGSAGPLMKGMHIQMRKNANGMKEEVMRFFTLSGDVYRDNFNRIWYQMGPGAAIYHYGSDPMVPEIESPLVQIKGQSYTPVFKLISPDRTGGSCETIIQNPMVFRFHWWGVEPIPRGESNIGEEDVPEYVSNYIIQDPWKQGSYNYSETAEVGNPTHEENDVKPHKKHKFMGVYINPFSRHALLSGRRFPPIDPRGKRLAEQI